jgi:hypothetical protein
MRSSLTSLRAIRRTSTFFGAINVDIQAELAKPDPTGWRLLRPGPPVDLW